ncbi:MAG: hypothetical protein AAF700_05175 [Pseudomonadota bacterium]
MDELKLLRDRLIALAAPPEPQSGPARLIELNGPGSAQAAFEREVSLTRLPRALLFETKEGAQLGVSVASGRVLSLDIADLPRDADITLPLILAEEDAEAVSLASVLVSRFLTSADALTVTATFNPPTRHGLGINAALLESRAQPAKDEAPEFDSFLGHIQANCTAWIVLRAGVIEEVEGSATYQTRLRDLAATLDEAEHGEASGLHCVMLTTQESDETILCASDDHALAFAVVPQSAKLALLDEWRSV